MSRFLLVDSFIVFYIFLLIIGCNKRKNLNNAQEIILLLDSTESIINNPKMRIDIDKIVFTYNDSIVMSRHYGESVLQSIFFKMDDNYYEKRITRTMLGEYTGIDSILTLTQKDTSFVYYSGIEFFALVMQLTLSDCQYEISHHNQGYMTSKRSLYDTAYQEIFFYDKNYLIDKFVNTFKDNKYVYVKK